MIVAHNIEIEHSGDIVGCDGGRETVGIGDIWLSLRDGDNEMRELEAGERRQVSGAGVASELLEAAQCWHGGCNSSEVEERVKMHVGILDPVRRY